MFEILLFDVYLQTAPPSLAGPFAVLGSVNECDSLSFNLVAELLLGFSGNSEQLGMSRFLR